jgi:hypothetical protein
MNPSKGNDEPEDIPEAQRVGQHFASKLNTDWEVDNPDQLLQSASPDSRNEDPASQVPSGPLPNGRGSEIPENEVQSIVVAISSTPAS